MVTLRSRDKQTVPVDRRTKSAQKNAARKIDLKIEGTPKSGNRRKRHEQEDTISPTRKLRSRRTAKGEEKIIKTSKTEIKTSGHMEKEDNFKELENIIDKSTVSVKKSKDNLRKSTAKKPVTSNIKSVASNIKPVTSNIKSGITKNSAAEQPPISPKPLRLKNATSKRKRSNKYLRDFPGDLEECSPLPAEETTTTVRKSLRTRSPIMANTGATTVDITKKRSTVPLEPNIKPSPNIKSPQDISRTFDKTINSPIKTPESVLGKRSTTKSIQSRRPSEKNQEKIGKKKRRDDNQLVNETLSLERELSVCSMILNRSHRKNKNKKEKTDVDYELPSVSNTPTTPKDPKLINLEKEMNLFECSASPIANAYALTGGPRQITDNKTKNVSQHNSPKKKHSKGKLSKTLLKTPVRHTFRKSELDSVNESLFDGSEDEIDEEGDGYGLYPLSRALTPELNEVKEKSNQNSNKGNQNSDKEQRYNDWLERHRSDYKKFQDVSLCIE